MGPITAFPIDLPDYTLRTLSETDRETLQNLFEKCADYVQIVNGEDVSPTEADDALSGGPPGRSLKDKFLFGLFDPQGELVAVLDAFKNYPDAGTWWIGLLMLAPAVRGQGIGRKLMDGFTQYIHSQGGAAIMLGVVEDNKAAYDFWQRMGFTLQSKTDPRPFGQKLQAVYVLRRSKDGKI
jgi:GNAT superfamily N-acetyltransferase